jgi:hypothetical protein
MKRVWVVGMMVVLAMAGFARAQSTLDALDQELKEAQQQHDDVTAQNLSNFFSQVDQAMQSSDAAVALWQQAGGAMPALTGTTTQYSTETVTEREAREAKDKANTDALGGMLQVHCGLLHYGGQFVTDPKQKGLQDDFNGWLMKIAQAYPQLGASASDNTTAQGGGGGEHKHHHDNGGGAGAAPPPPPLNFGDLKGKTLHDSPITKLLGFTVAFKDKEQGSWSVKQIPALFKSNILDPSRATPNETTLSNWDIYVAMMQADETDPDKWTSTDYPPLQYERAYDDCVMSPNTDKIQTLVQIIHTNPTHPNAPDWLTRTKALLDAYRSGHGGAPPAVVQNTPAPTTTSNGNVTVEQQGDAQIITTHNTNGTANPAQPH